jgi:hypothetical protein
LSDITSRLAALGFAGHCACTFYLVFKEPATCCLAPPARFHASAATLLPVSSISFRGTLQSYRAIPPPSTPFLAHRRFFNRFLLPLEGAFETADTTQSDASPFPVFRALDGRRWSCELKEVFDAALLRASSERPFDPRFRASIATADHARSIQYTHRFRGCQYRQSPHQQLNRNRVTDGLVKL